jgi:glycosyltransferase involved in cell wall biosynthesis
VLADVKPIGKLSARPHPSPPPLSPIRVAIVAASMRIVGGQSVQAQALIDGWRGDPRIAARLVPIDPIPPQPFDRLTAIKYVRTVATQLTYWPLLVRALRQADVVHVFSASYASFLLAPLPAVLVARALGKPVLLNYHSGEAPDHLARSRIARHVLRRRVHLNAVPSTFLRDVLASFGIPAHVVANSVDLCRFRYRARDPLRPVLISTRNFEPMYNVACTLRAFAAVQRRYPDASLTLVGAGSQDAALRSLAAGLGLRQVRFLGRVSSASIHEQYDQADIYIQTPSIDNMPLSVLEAFASGLPVVSTGVGGVPAMLRDGEHGLLVADDDAEAAAGCVIDLLDSPEKARALAAAARQTCERYEWPVVREDWFALYEALAATSAGQPAPVEAT